MHKTSPRFWKCFERLPDVVKKHAKERYALLKENPTHPSLHFKKVGNFWSIRIDLEYRALAVEDNSDFIWIWIGNHDDYERLIR